MSSLRTVTKNTNFGFAKILIFLELLGVDKEENLQ
jgi:hypothetical protein